MGNLKFTPKVISKEFKNLLKDIVSNDVIVVYRHILPDFDALGTQMGLVNWIKDNFPKKEVHYVGERHVTFMPDLFVEPEKLSQEWYEEHKGKYLAIVVDTATTDRISEFVSGYATKVIKIDHHPNVEPFGDVNIVYDNFAAASELLALFCETYGNRYPVNKEAARCFYIGITGDTGGFKYPDTSGMTLRLGADLLDTGLNPSEISCQMYKSTFKTIEFLKFVLNTYKFSPKGICYYVVSKEDQDRLGITLNEGKLHVNTFRNVEGVDISMSITEDVEDKKWRVSLRSTKTKINGVAAKFHGGGHDFASGCEIKTLDELPSLVAALEEAIGD
ncbi:MAG TPA: hypothetical protein DCY93_03330 [Firmicutes bacterium]|nr:hypothetical protein [Bacillota bacterium]